MKRTILVAVIIAIAIGGSNVCATLTRFAHAPPGVDGPYSFSAGMRLPVVVVNDAQNSFPILLGFLFIFAALESFFLCSISATMSGESAILCISGMGRSSSAAGKWNVLPGRVKLQVRCCKTRATLVLRGPRFARPPQDEGGADG